MSHVRVTYSGLISLIVGLGTLFTGLIFTLIITRQLSQEEFGTWSLIGTLITYVTIIDPIIAYWNTREIARGQDTGKTAIVSSSFMIPLAVFVYLGIAYFFGQQIELDYTILMLAAILIPVNFLRGLLVGIAHGFKPHIEAYGLLIFELSKIVIALILIYFLDLGLFGLILTVFLATLANVIILLIKTKEKLYGKFQIKFLKKWLRLFWLPSYPQISAILTTSDVAIFSLITGSVGSLAYWTAAMTISRIVHHSSDITKALYPKLLGGGKKEYFQDNLRIVFYFAFPLAAMSFTFMRPSLFALNPIYEVATPVLVFLIPAMFLRTLSEIFSQALRGIERVDVNEKASFKDYLKSKLFFLPTLRNIQRGGYLVCLGLIILLFLPYSQNDIDLVIIWAVIALATHIPYNIYFHLLIKREFRPKIDYFSMLKYVLSSVIVFGLVFFLMNNYLEYKNSIFEFLPQLLIYVIIGIAGYLGLTYAIDKHTRKLFKLVISEIKGNQVQK